MSEKHRLHPLRGRTDKEEVWEQITGLGYRKRITGFVHFTERLAGSGDAERYSEAHYIRFIKTQTIITVRLSNILQFSFLYAVNPLNILGINFLGRRLSLSITMGCTALFFLLLNICTSR